MISGCVGPQGDGYDPAELLTADAAQEYHSTQIATFADTARRHGHRDHDDLRRRGDRDHARGRASAGMPVAISFTVETDGRLPSGQPLGEAIEQVDAATDGAPAYYMINCAHPTHFEDVLDAGGALARADPRPARERVDARATPSSTRRPSSTRAIPATSAPATRRCASSCRSSTCSAAAAAPITAT